MPKTVNIIILGALKEASKIVDSANKLSIKVSQADDIEQAIKAAASTNSSMMFVESSLSSAELFGTLKENKLTLPVVVVGPSSPARNAAQAIRLGAYEYVPTPVDAKLISSILSKIEVVEVGADSTEFNPIAGDARTIAMLESAAKFAASNATVLLRGESGTGKEVFSKFIHLNSPRKDKPFVSLNCAAIPENLLESELFGHEKGAFSGALSRRVGKFEQANGGTLLLDEISEMDVNLQTKLLRAIQERVIDPIGSSEPVPVDIRLIATTNRDLEKEVEKGTFREDLYFRLNVVMLPIPPLRERKGDILPLAEHFANVYGEQNGIMNIEISPEAASKLEGCYWKGNVRELENTIHRAVLMMGSDSVMKEEHIIISPMSEAAAVNTQSEVSNLPVGVAGAYGAASSGFQGGFSKNIPPMVGRTVHDVERELILDTLKYCQGNRIHAADILGISIKILREKLDNYEKESAPSEGEHSADPAQI